MVENEHINEVGDDITMTVNCIGNRLTQELEICGYNQGDLDCSESQGSQ